MIRRIVLSSLALVVLGGVATPAMADALSVDKDSNGGGHGFCVGLGGANGSRPDGICLWIPTD